MFRSDVQSITKPPVFSSQASLVLIYRTTEKMKGCPPGALKPKAVTDTTPQPLGFEEGALNLSRPPIVWKFGEGIKLKRRLQHSTMVRNCEILRQ
ncbi:hypothetical protein TNCV_3957891 [Trichonephila clavipes]|nr:hypothetical protein TNCV_3957891 [Trichonephila clavipes]